jgi:hypothetical protein
MSLEEFLEIKIKIWESEILGVWSFSYFFAIGFRKKKKSNSTTWLNFQSLLKAAFLAPLWFSQGLWQKGGSYTSVQVLIRVKAVGGTCHIYFHLNKRTLESKSKVVWRPWMTLFC